MLLAEELALIAIDPRSGRHAIATRDHLNACLAGLLLAEVQLGDGPPSALLDATADVAAAAGPKPKRVLSAMSRGLASRLGTGTWDSVMAGLVDAGVVAPSTGGLRPGNPVVDCAARDAIVERLRAAAGGAAPLDVRTAALLSMTGPAQLLELVAPQRSTRKHARRRIDHALDETSMQGVADSVRTVLADAAAVAAVASTSVYVAASG